MFEGNKFFPLTGMPIWKIARSRTLLAVWLPEPLTVATWRLKSLMLGFTNLLPFQDVEGSRPAGATAKR